MDKYLVVLSSLSMISVNGFNLHGTESDANKPNVIFILADDLGWADLPVYGNQFNEAPNIDKLAEDGIRFTNAYAASPVSSPTRASIMSGQYPARLGINDFILGHWRPYEQVTVPRNRTQFLPEEIITIGEIMKMAGYSTGYFGKWHLGVEPQHHPLRQGFDEANIGQGAYNVKFNPPRESKNSIRFSDQITEFGLQFIEKNRDRPFFLLLSHSDVHVQLNADSTLINKYLNKKTVPGYPGNAVYAAMVEHLDTNIGEIMDKLEETGLENNTILIFYSDNGGLIARYDRIPLIAEDKIPIYKDSPLKYIASSNAPLRAEKGTLYEGGIRVPLIIRWPGKIPEGKVSEAIVSSIDFYPTLLDITGIPAPSDQIIDGKSILPAITRDEYNPERTIFWHYPVYHHDVPTSAVRNGNWKLIENLVTNDLSLYNLRYDLGENLNLVDLYPEKACELESLLNNWQEYIRADFPVMNPAFDENKRFQWGKYPFEE